MNLKKIKSRLIYFINFILNRNIKFTGSFSNWKSAKKKSYGYNHHVIINKKKESFIKVLKGEAKYERDTFLFYKKMATSYSLTSYSPSISKSLDENPQPEQLYNHDVSFIEEA